MNDVNDWQPCTLSTDQERAKHKGLEYLSWGCVCVFCLLMELGACRHEKSRLNPGRKRKRRSAKAEPVNFLSAVRGQSSAVSEMEGDKILLLTPFMGEKSGRRIRGSALDNTFINVYTKKSQGEMGC